MVNQYQERVHELMNDVYAKARDLLSFSEEVGDAGDELWIKYKDIRIVIFRDKEYIDGDHILMQKFVPKNNA